MTANDKTGGARDPDTRKVILDATVQLMMAEGYAAATSRRVAAAAGVKSALVHYYFPRLDDLFVAVFRRGATANIERQQRALASDKPLRALWECVSDPHDAQLLLEFLALANHRKVIRSEIAEWAERWRETQVVALNFILREHSVDADAFPADAVAFVLSAIGQTLVNDSTVGITGGHGATVGLVERFIDRFEMSRPPPANRAPDAEDRTKNGHNALGANDQRR
jgi:AcrR family transcriptional regulator